jgi:hypothetical protein
MIITKTITYWISFSNGTNLGCCIVNATDPRAAHLKTIELGINPGGELMIVPFDNSPSSKLEIAKWGKNKLITKQQLFNAGYISTDQMDRDTQEQIGRDKRVIRICQRCNEAKCICS